MSKKIHSKPLIELENVSLTLSGQSIVKDISLTIMPNEIVSLIGLNGAGKSTILKLILGIHKPTDGKVTRHTKRIGYVPQKFEFDRTIPLSVHELLKIYSQASDAKIEVKLKELSIHHLKARNIGALSGGEMQRVLIVNALLMEPDLILLDEPTSGLDVVGEKDFYCSIEEIQKKYKLTVVIVSHDIHLVFKHAKTIFCVDHCLVCHGHPEQVKKSDAFKKLFGPHLVPFKHHENEPHS